MPASLAYLIAQGIWVDSMARSYQPHERMTLASGILGIWLAFAFPASAQDNSETSEWTEAATSYLERALDIMEEFSIKREAIDWDAFRAEALASADSVESIEQLHASVRSAVRGLGDGHSLFYPPDVAQRQEAAGPITDALPWWAPHSEVVDERISYLMVPRYIGTNPERMTRFADEVQAAIREVDQITTCGWIVDVRANGGGTVFPMIAGIGPLVGEGELSGGVNSAGGRYVRWYRGGRVGVGDVENARVSGAPYVLKRRDPPIALLIGPRTASSGEATALTFIGRPNTRVFGLPSAGLTTANSPFRLPDGAVLSLAVSVMMDRKGKTYGESIEPDEQVAESDSDLPLPEQPVVQRAAAWLRRHAMCQE